MKFHLLATIFVFFCAKSIAQEEGDDRCKRSNVAFVMDMSLSTTSYHKVEKQIIQRIVDEFPERSQFCLVTFGTTQTQRECFKAETTAAKFKEKVAKLTGKEEGVHTTLDKALKEVPRDFPVVKDERENNYLFVLTDGRWNLDDPEREEKIRDDASFPKVKNYVFKLGNYADALVVKGLLPYGQSEKNTMTIRRSSYRPEKVTTMVKQALKQACAPAPAEPKCTNVVDIGFLIDRSGSIGETNFKNVLLPYVVNITREFNISMNGTHAGALVFGSVYDVRVEIPMDRYYDTNSFISAVLRIEYPRGQSTYINKAFRVANDELFNYTPRPGVKRYAFLLTDGNQTYGKDPVWGKVKPEDEAKNLWDKNIDVIAIGIGSVDKPALERMTNNGKNGSVITVENFSGLAESMQTVMNFFCTVCKMNLVVVLDASGSTELGFKAGKYVLLQIAKLAQLKPGGSQISVITFAIEGSVEIQFADLSYSDFEVNVAGQLYFRGGRTAIESGLKLVPEAMKHSPSNNNKKAVLVITDGFQTAGSIDEVKRQADAIRKEGYPIKTMSLHTKKWLKEEDGDPLRTLEYISGGEAENSFFMSPPPNRDIEDEAFQKEVTATVMKALRNICASKGSKK